MDAATPRNAGEKGRPDPIVVGVDGTASSQRALDWAVGEAEARGARVLALSAYLPATMASAAPFATWEPAFNEELADRARQVLTEAVAAVANSHPNVEIERRVVKGMAASVLIEASRQASALVVGSRGHRPLVGLMVGSVSQHCVIQAHCPVVVVGPGADVESLPGQGSPRATGVNWCPP